jgi:histidine triad (HIT) family protein
MADCIFCKIIDGSIPSKKVAESTNFLAFLDINPTAAGHTLIVPKKHSTNLFDLPEFLGGEFLEFSQRVAAAVVAATKADGFHLNLNNGPAAGQVVFHTHFHIIPRKLHDGTRLFETHVPMTPEQLEVVRQEIIKCIR